MIATAVIGAGVAGLSAALYLQRSGHCVTVFDPMPPAGGASYGNAGLICNDIVVPVGLPGLLRKVPGWLADPEGPLVVRPSYFPKALPWLIKRVAASRLSRVLEISDAMQAMHRDSIACWRELLGEHSFDDLVRNVGYVRIWLGDAELSSIERTLYDRHAIPIQSLDARALRDLYPAIAPDFRRGMLLPGNAYTISPQRIVRTLGERLLAEGGAIVAERTLKIVREGNGWRLINNISNRIARRVVVAAGAWSRELLDPLGVRVALETERGYHAMLPSPNIQLPIPISYKDGGFAMASMETGLRAAGTVEIAGLHATPDERRAQILIGRVKRVFPTLAHGEPAYWMGHRPSTPDTLPIVGPVDRHPGLFLTLGHGHFGMTGGPPSGRLVAQIVNGEKPSIDPAPFSASRFA